MTGDRSIQELHLKQPGFTYSASRPCTKHRERIEKFRATGNLKHLSRNELDEAGFAHDAAYSGSNYLARRTISDKTLKDRAYEIAKNGGYDGHQRALASKIYKFFDKKTGLAAIATRKAGMSVNE